jgi:hypothetical protein
LIGGATGGAGVEFGDAADRDVGAILYNHVGNVMSFRANASEQARLDSVGFGIKETNPTEALDIDSDAIRLRQSQTPATAGAVGTTGMICWSTGHVYVAVGTDTWMRAALSSW